MANEFIKIYVEDKEAQQLLKSIRDRYGNLYQILNAIGDEYTKRVDNRFESETDPDGNKWLPTRVLSNYLGFVGTRKGYKRKQAYTKDGQWRAAFSRYLAGKKILQLTGALRGDIHYQADAASLTIGTSGRIPYAGIQQFGGTAGRGRTVRIPARPYLARNVGDGLELGSGDQAMVVERLSAYLDTGKI
jgi:phage gpG-like protein